MFFFMQLAFNKRTAIDMLVELLLLPLRDAIKDVGNNDHYKSKDDIVDDIDDITTQLL